MPRRTRSSSLKTSRNYSGAQSQKPSWATQYKRRAPRSSHQLYHVPIRQAARRASRGKVLGTVVVAPANVFPRNAQRFERETLATPVKTSIGVCKKRKRYKKDMLRKVAAQMKAGGAGTLAAWRKRRRRVPPREVHAC